MPKLNQNSHSFKKKREKLAVNSIVFAQNKFYLMPKALNAIDVVLNTTTHIQFVVAVQAVCINNAIRHAFLFDNRR